MKGRVVLIGPGRLGQAIARLLCDAGYDLRALISRDPVRAVAAARFAGCRNAASADLSRVAEGELILLALPDDQLGAMAATLRRDGHLRPGATLIHFSGLHPAAILLGKEGPPLRALSLHPLQTFADSVMGVRNLPGTTFAVEGTPDVIPLGEALVADLGGRSLVLSAEQKPLYHAAACVASNYMVTLVDTACQIFSACGFGQEEAFHYLTPLLRGTGRNLAALGPKLALTGPIARGDVRTVGKHLRAIAHLPGGVDQIYRILGIKTVELALKKGTLDAEAAEEILRLLESDGES
ncbi:hypothetical protein DSOUD_3008 [Desulfuromonas soudanensis]|uniref:DUF2520 domain-containing protein n=1 Tax=Desulfuromonas soudanensis TaxID=1603606 RepID=A0A0M4D3G4_9BACT|nr:hypothetical protein DSOUD_3008 [Desulfuromonas soudanensis]